MSDAEIAPIVVDLGKKQRKQVKQLTKGKGKLMQSVNDCLDELVRSETIPEGSQPVIIVVEKKPKRYRWAFGL